MVDAGAVNALLTQYRIRRRCLCAVYPLLFQDLH